MSIKVRTDKKYVILGGQAVREIYEGAKVNGAETIIVEEPATDLHSPRTVNLSTNQPELHAGLKIYYSIGIITEANGTKREFTEYEDIYHFMLACRPSKGSETHFLLRPAESVKDLEEKSIVPYNLVSGDELPDNPPGATKGMVYKYMMMGLHTFWVFDRAGLGKTIVEEVNKRPQVISKGGHVFQLGEGSIANTSNLFLGLLVDYYQISSGINGMDAQVAFVRDPEYRLLIYRYLKSIFISFIGKNSKYLDTEYSSVNLNETSTNNADLIIRLSHMILSKYLK